MRVIRGGGEDPKPDDAETMWFCPKCNGAYGDDGQGRHGAGLGRELGRDAPEAAGL